MFDILPQIPAASRFQSLVDSSRHSDISPYRLVGMALKRKMSLVDFKEVLFQAVPSRCCLFQISPCEASKPPLPSGQCCHVP